MSPLDTKPYVRYHAELGYEYTPDVMQTLPRPGGGSYTIQINDQGIRSDRKFEPSVPAGKTRILVLGDSFAAGQFVSNEHRFSEVLERRQPCLEIINLALEGTGTDQQVMLLERAIAQFDFDIVMILPFVQNIRRNLADAREAWDATTERMVWRGKPRFDLIDGELMLRNVPVPEALLETLADNGATDTSSASLKIKSALNAFAAVKMTKALLYHCIAWEPFPEYRHRNGRAWRLMEALLLRAKSLVGNKPLVIVPVFYDVYIRFKMAHNYWQRMQSLERHAGIHAIDVLPYFRAQSEHLERLYLAEDGHFSIHGHLVLAVAIETELARLGLARTARA